MKRKELFWLVGTLLYVLIVSVVFFGINIFKVNYTIDINVHDTYFVMASYHFLFLFGTFVFFFVYLARMLRRNFKNLAANVVFIFSNLLLIVIMTYIISLVAELTEYDSYTEYPPLSADSVVQKGNRFGILSNVFVLIQVVLIVLLTYSAFKTGKNYKTNS